LQSSLQACNQNLSAIDFTNMTKNTLIYFFSLALITIYSCDPARRKGEDPLPTKGTKPAELAFICNEGNFQFGNASLTIYDFANDILVQDAFNSANNRPLGDVLQSLFIKNNELFLVVNNSQRIEVIDLKTQKLLRTYSGFHSPRNITLKAGNLAYVSEYYKDEIKLIDLSTGTIEKNITVPGWHDEMLLHGNKLFVTTTNRNKLYVVNTTTDELTDSIELRAGGHAIVLDQTNKIWVLCGGASTSGRAAIYCINPNNNIIEKTIELPNNDASRLVINAVGSELYYINEHIYKLPIQANNAPSTPFIQSNNNRFYALAFNPFRNELWAADAVDYVQRSTIMRFNNNGEQIGGFRSGINSGFISFYKE
jgi:DNA-binding beta-propeller fold protein YncE